MQSRYAQRIKLGLIGPPSAGKTHFVHSYIFGTSTHKLIAPTIAVQFYERVINLGDREVALRIWDSSGQAKYKPIVPYHLRECQVVILMYDLTSQQSFQQLEKWIVLLQKEHFGLEDKKIIVLGNKLDLVRSGQANRQVTYAEVKHLLVNHDLPTTDIYQITSKEPKSEDLYYIKDILNEILSQVIEERTIDQIQTMRVKFQSEGGIRLTQHQIQTNQAICSAKGDSGGVCGQLACGECQIY